MPAYPKKISGVSKFSIYGILDVLKPVYAGWAVPEVRRDSSMSITSFISYLQN